MYVESDVCRYQEIIYKLSKLLAEVQVSVFCWDFFLSEFVYLHTVVRNMGEIETLKPFRIPMKIVALYTWGGFLEADVVEPGKARSINILHRINHKYWVHIDICLPIYHLYSVVRHEKVLLPPHEDIVRLLQFFIVEAVWVEILGILAER